jgi:hypothetical protein
MLPVFKGRKILQRNRWPVAVPFYDLRPCPDCGALVHGDYGQLLHTDSHDALEQELRGEKEVPEVEGYVVGQGRTEATIDYYADER